MTIYRHNTAQVNFQYVQEIRPQFSSVTMIEFLNLQTGKFEYFDKRTYKRFFTKIV